MKWSTPKPSHYQNDLSRPYKLNLDLTEIRNGYREIIAFLKLILQLSLQAIVTPERDKINQGGPGLVRSIA